MTRKKKGDIWIGGDVGYLDGVDADYCVIEKTGPKSWDYRVIAYCFKKEDAELIAAAVKAAKEVRQ